MSTGHVEFVNVSKRFRQGAIHTRLRDAIPALATRPFRRKRNPAEIGEGEFWALRDVSFVVKPGQALGVIGPNGAGKSTVLKLLTRIIQPTTGTCRLRGRVGALIEVAAGFHPDLTGRENVFLQGVIMGMPRREIARKFDEIVAFAEIAAFIDTPVKRYSTGMEARLGFAIAAHLEPDVLLVDEVLAVGDAAFQVRAFAKVTELVRREIPVVMVTHQLESMAILCSHAILLDRGVVLRAGTPGECIAAYQARSDALQLPEGEDAGVRIEEIRLSEVVVRSGERLEVGLDCSVRKRASEPETVWLRVRCARTGATVYEISSAEFGDPLPTARAFALSFELQMNLPRGSYHIETLVWNLAQGRSSFAGPSSQVEVIAEVPFGEEDSLQPRVRLMRTVF